jgi:uncharacterized membrane protein
VKQPLRYIRFWSFLAITAVGGLAITPALGIARAMLIGFDLGAVSFIVSTLVMMSSASAARMRKQAAANDADHYILLIIGGLVVSVVLVAVWVELTGASGHKGLALGTAAITLLIAWVFSNLLTTLHYAHLFYLADDGGDDSGGLEFPKEPTPDYGDFAYYSFVLGMTFQVSDVQITARPMRRLAMYHGLAAFLFNIVVVALSVSLLGGLLQ